MKTFAGRRAASAHFHLVMMGMARADHAGHGVVIAGELLVEKFAAVRFGIIGDTIDFAQVGAETGWARRRSR